MNKLSLLLLCLFSMALWSRDNPFIHPQSPSQTLDNPSSDMFISQEITLPRESRAIRKISVTFIKSNGTEEVVEKKFDKGLNCTKIKKLLITQDNAPTQKALPQETSLWVKNGVTDIELITQNPKNNDFLLDNPRRLVIDFDKKSELKSQMTLSHPLVKSVGVVEKTHFFRIVLTLKEGTEAFIYPLSNGYGVRLEQH